MKEKRKKTKNMAMYHNIFITGKIISFQNFYLLTQNY